ncbi:methyl-accepting chemotaxis protein [Marinobacterium litorale]|uniref:methyl-accepting chemotaxis protein n=1 Tax=Marinobacterium litorale TaxID=404770 RepID=UPI0004055648|nr:methyl-accepting chemotaxis protein [Marinobacterium litorale]
MLQSNSNANTGRGLSIRSWLLFAATLAFLPALALILFNIHIQSSLDSLSLATSVPQPLRPELARLSASLDTGTLALLAALPILLLLAFLILNRALIKPLLQVKSTFEEIKNRHGDISASLPTTGSAELARTGEAYNDFSTALKQMIAQSRQRSVKVSLGAAQLQRIISKVQAAADNQSNGARLVFQSSQEATQAINEIAGHTQLIAQRNQHNLEEINNSSRELLRIKEQIQAIEQQVTQFQGTVQKLSANSENIVSVLAMVQGFSEQTNLLALNASIEAARAGEAGRGFAVVADEVRSLSLKVSDATHEIDANINDMTQLVESTRQGSQAIMAHVTETESFIGETHTKFGTMLNDFEQLNNQLGEISAAVEELSYTNGSTHDNISSINELSDNIQEEIEISAGYSQTLESATEEMQELLSHFHIGYGGFEEIISTAKGWANEVEQQLNRMAEEGHNLFDHNYQRINPDQQPEKFATGYAERYEQLLQPMFDRFIHEKPEFIIASAFDINGYLPAHNSKISKPITGDFETDNALSRHRRIYAGNRAEKRRAANTAPFLLQTFIRDTGEILNSISVPLYVSGRHWGNFCTAFAPERLLEID